MLIALCHSGAAIAQQQIGNPCGSLENGYGPYDYRKEKDGALRIVEKHHFSPAVEALVGSIGSAYIGPDLEYVLRASPNHHRALVAVIRLGDKTRSPQPPHLTLSIECFLERAVRFQPDDTVARALYAQYLGKLGRRAEGIALLDGGLAYVDRNPMSAYNFGLVYLELGDPERALKQAHAAMASGDPRTELRDQLQKAGKWQEPPAAVQPPR